MNPTQPLYVSADIVTRNLVPQPSQQLVVTDVFDIPSFDIPTPQQPSQHSQHSQPSQHSQHSQLQQPITQSNFIKSINHNAMADVMNIIAVQKQKTPSVTTKQTDVSLQMKSSAPPALIHAATSCSSSYKDASQLANPHGLSSGVKSDSSKKNNKLARANKGISKVIVEEEDKDSAIDYDDDDPSIKKIKLSLFHFAKDITFNLIFAIPFLRTKLGAILKEQSLAINQIERIFDEFKDHLNKFQLESIKKYVCEDGIRDKLNFILETGFNKILADGVIDINDAPQFNQLVYFIIKSFNDINHGKVYRFHVSKEHVMLLLHFILKSVFSLTLKGQEEQMAIGLLDTSFKLVHLEVLPLVSKRWYHKFRICSNVKDIEDMIE